MNKKHAFTFAILCCLPLSQKTFANKSIENPRQRMDHFISFESIKKTFPAIKNWFTKIKKQPLIISADSLTKTGDRFGTQWSYLSKSKTNDKTEDGVKFGTFVHDETMIYLRAGLKNKSFKAPNISLIGNDLFSQHSLKSINPGLGFQWEKQSISVSGEIRASMPYSGQHSPLFYRISDKKTSGEILIQARYKIGSDKKSSSQSIKKKIDPYNVAAN